MNLVHNPVLALPSIAKLRELPEEVRMEFRNVLEELRQDAAKRADQAWKRHKGPMAVYWRAVAVYARHIRRALR